jgi:DNA-binding FadR family transcriptional regulator
MTPDAGAAGIAAQFRRAIIQGTYAYGERLPAEREIAETLRTSRTTVRHALRLLEENELVRRRAGSGTFVVHSAQEQREIAEITSPLELMDVRLALEPHIARLAVVHSTARDIETISSVLGQLDSVGPDLCRFTELDESFHLSLAHATHNPLIVLTYRHINAVRGHAQWKMVKHKLLTPKRIAEYNVEHRAIFDAVCSRDAEGAAGLIERHVSGARRDLLGAQST